MITATIIAIIGLIVITPITFILFFTDNSLSVTVPLLTIGLIFYQIGLSMFEANVIRFGVDQLQFASKKNSVSLYTGIIGQSLW